MIALSQKKIKAILFDLGQTLFMFDDAKASEFYRQGARLSYDFLKSCGQPVGNFKKYCWRNLITIRSRYILSNILGRDFDSLKLLKKNNRKKDVRLDEKQWEQLSWCWYEPLVKLSSMEVDLAATLTQFRCDGLKLGILSNTFVNRCSLDKHLSKMGLLDFFPVRMYSYDFKFRKPDARIFKIAAERMGFGPENIMFVGDRVDNDVKPALKLGMTAVHKPVAKNRNKKTPSGAYRIDELCELPKLIAKINS